MKKITLTTIALILAASLTMSSCIGSFNLFNNYAKWQRTMTNSKIVNGIVGLILQPIVGTVCLTVDALVLNTIEFWSGNNPVKRAGIDYVKGTDGQTYAIETTRKGYKITNPDGRVTLLTHNAKTQTWSITQNGKTLPLVRHNDDGTIVAYLQNGQQMTLSNDLAGLQQLKNTTQANHYYASR